jgi:hypothetical protein
VLVLLDRLDSFADDDQIEQVGQLDCLGDDGVTRGVLREMGDKGLIDLDNIDRVVPKVAER